MSDDRLKAIFAKQDAAEEERRAAEMRKREAAEEHGRQVAVMEHHWAASSRLLDQAIASLNEVFASRRMVLSRGGSTTQGAPVLAAFTIYYRREGENSGARATFVNVSTLGQVSWRMSSATVTPAKSETLQLPVPEETWRNALLTFIELNTPY